MTEPVLVSWNDEDYLRARDCMLEILRNNGWTIDPQRRDEKEFDNAFQHAIGILALTALPLASGKDNLQQER